MQYENIINYDLDNQRLNIKYLLCTIYTPKYSGVNNILQRLACKWNPSRPCHLISWSWMEPEIILYFFGLLSKPEEKVVCYFYLQGVQPARR